MVSSSGGSSLEFFWGARPHGEHCARAYNGGLGAEPPAGSRGRAPGQGVWGRSPPWSWNTFSFWTFTGSHKCVDFSKIWKRKKSQIFVLSLQKWSLISCDTAQTNCELIKSNKTLRYKLFTSVYIVQYNVNWCKPVRPKLPWKNLGGLGKIWEGLCPPGLNVEPPLPDWLIDWSKVSSSN